MTQNDSFRRKIIYISAIAVLLVPLSVISQPATVKKGGASTSGGLLSKMRTQYRLSQAELSEIDPASESMKLATLGLRPVAVTLLWNRIQESKKKEQWDRLRTATQTLIALQPNFVKVWEFQAHNLSYNISREFDDYQYRYHWVKEGLSYLMTGIAYNRKDHRILDQLGFFFGLKLGRSDEKQQFRRLYRRDKDYHAKLVEEHNINRQDIYSVDLGGADNWLTAYQWYDRSVGMVEQGMQRRTSGIMFYKGAPSQLRNYAIDLERELRPNDAAREAWQVALEGWVEYGNREIRTSTQVPVFLDRLAEAKNEIDELRRELDKFFPKVRDEMLAARRAKMTPELWEAYNMPLQEMTDIEMGRLHHMAKGIINPPHEADFTALLNKKIAAGELTLDEKTKVEMDRINLEIQLKARDLDFVSKYRGTVNYPYWKERCEAESKDLTIRARQSLFDAREAVKDTRFDEQIVRKQKTDEKGQVVLDENNQPMIVEEKVPGAIQHFEEAFRLWKEILTVHTDLEDDVMEDDLVQAMKEYYSNLRKVQAEWPLDFPLQYLVDRRARRQFPDGLPTTDRELAERLEIQKELNKAKQETENDANKQPMPNPDKSGDGEKTKKVKKTDPKKDDPANQDPMKDPAKKPAEKETPKKESVKKDPPKKDSDANKKSDKESKEKTADKK